MTRDPAFRLRYRLRRLVTAERAHASAPGTWEYLAGTSRATELAQLDAVLEVLRVNRELGFLDRAFVADWLAEDVPAAVRQWVALNLVPLLAEEAVPHD